MSYLTYYATKNNPVVENTLSISNDFFRCFHYGFFARPCVIDRTGVTNTFSNVRVCTKYPYIIHNNASSFSDTCDSVASEINYNDIIVMLSGIDSLVALVSLLRVKKSSNIKAVYNSELSDTVVRNILPRLHKLFHFDYMYSNRKI